MFLDVDSSGKVRPRRSGRCWSRRRIKWPWGSRDDSRSQRILWLLEELGLLPYQITQHKHDPRTRLTPVALKQVHLLGKSPVIEDGGRVVSESGAIIDYILRR